jgi:hypothetical protein
LLGKDVGRAIITDNLFKGPERIDNRSRGIVRIANNVGLPAKSSSNDAPAE